VRGEHRLYDDALASSFGLYAERITINTAQLGTTFGDNPRVDLTILHSVIEYVHISFQDTASLARTVTPNRL